MLILFAHIYIHISCAFILLENDVCKKPDFVEKRVLSIKQNCNSIVMSFEEYEFVTANQIQLVILQ